MSEHEAWGSIRVTLADPSEELAPDAGDRLDALGALLAERDDVGGVETRDPSFITEGPDFVAVERPELVVYTTVPGRPDVEVAVRDRAAALGLAVALEGQDHHGDDWRDAWKRYYRSLRFRAGRSALMIRPSWIAREPDDPVCELILDPGRAFGTGLHESTRLCLQSLVELVAQGRPTPTQVLDLGCGSGILGLAALRLWPDLGRLVLADHDPEAVATAAENAEHNGIEVGPKLRCEVLDLLDASPEAGPRARFGQAELVLANIRPMVLIPGAARLKAATVPGGRLILSGILDQEGDEVLAAYPEFELLARPQEGDWCALILAAPADSLKDSFEGASA